MINQGVGYGNWIAPQQYAYTTNTLQYTPYQNWQASSWVCPTHNIQHAGQCPQCWEETNRQLSAPKSDLNDPVVWLKSRVQETIDEVNWKELAA